MSASVFPARAGMSRNTDAEVKTSGRVPRASGDEPAREQVQAWLDGCSPRERG